jgi:hypothetical protein
MQSTQDCFSKIGMVFLNEALGQSQILESVASERFHLWR